MRRVRPAVAAALAGLALAVAPPAAAQHGGHGGAGFEEPTLPAPRLAGIGNSRLPITTSSAEAQAYVDQGVNLLHCFWDYEAYRAFKTALIHDPDAAMAWWGLFLSLNYNQRERPEERRLALARARELAPEASDREQRYVRALARLNDLGGEAGKAAFVAEMEALVAAYPQDLEAKLFLVKFLLTESGGAVDAPGTTGEGRDAIARAKEILRPLLDAHPDSVGVNHYWVHAHEYDADPTPALAAAVKLPRLAPGSGHILHMPGHVHYKLGDYAAARQAFLAALAFDEAYLEEHGVAPVDHWNYVHNLDYLVANSAEDGRLEEGLRHAARVYELTVAPSRRDAVGAGFILYGGQTAPARLLLRFSAFDRAAAALEELLAEPRLAAGRAGDYHRGLLHYARGMSAARRGEVAEGAKAFGELLALNRRLAGDGASGSTLGSDWYFDASRRILSIAASELGGTLLSVQGHHDQAIAELEKAVAAEAAMGYWEPPHYARPVLESLAEAYMRAQRFADARRVYERELELRPNNGHAWFGIANSYVSEGDEEGARQAMRKLLEVWRDADADLPHLQAIRAWLAEHPP